MARNPVSGAALRQRTLIGNIGSSGWRRGDGAVKEKSRIAAPRTRILAEEPLESLYLVDMCAFGHQHILEMGCVQAGAVAIFHSPDIPDREWRGLEHVRTVATQQAHASKVGIEVGTQPGEHLSDRVAEIEDIFAEVARNEPGFSGEVDIRLDREPFVARGQEALQDVVVKAMTTVLGREPKITGMNGWTDAALLQAAGIPTLLMGATGGNYHTAGEWASISELVRLCDILEQTARHYLA